jgi:uncharacterized protein YigA (DUF484 family)
VLEERDELRRERSLLEKQVAIQRRHNAELARHLADL